jgi:hypothetical protein
MSIAYKLTTIANNVPIVFGEGKKLGFDEGLTDGEEIGYNIGYAAHLKWFWDGMLNKGNPANYIRRFYRWTNTSIYQPNQNIVHSTSSADSAQDTFRNAYFTDLIVDNVFSDASVLNCTFYNCLYLLNARTLHVTEKTSYASPFGLCSKLTEIRINGTIGKNGLNFSACPLNLESAISVITHLKNFTETDPDKVFTCTITFSPTTWEYLDADGENSPNGTTWAEYVAALGWNT